MSGNPKKPPGRPKGVPNKNTTALKEAILRAFESAGGDSYLLTVAQTDPRTFCTLLGKVLPMTVNANVDGSFTLRWSDAKPDA